MIHMIIAWMYINWHKALGCVWFIWSLFAGCDWMFLQFLGIFWHSRLVPVPEFQDSCKNIGANRPTGKQSQPTAATKSHIHKMSNKQRHIRVSLFFSFLFMLLNGFPVVKDLFRFIQPFAPLMAEKYLVDATRSAKWRWRSDGRSAEISQHCRVRWCPNVHFFVRDFQRLWNWQSLFVPSLGWS